MGKHSVFHATLSSFLSASKSPPRPGIIAREQYLLRRTATNPLGSGSSPLINHYRSGRHHCVIPKSGRHAYSRFRLSHEHIAGWIRNCGEPLCRCATLHRNASSGFSISGARPAAHTTAILLPFPLSRPHHRVLIPAERLLCHLSLIHLEAISICHRLTIRGLWCSVANKKGYWAGAALSPTKPFYPQPQTFGCNSISCITCYFHKPSVTVIANKGTLKLLVALYSIFYIPIFNPALDVKRAASGLVLPPPCSTSLRCSYRAFYLPRHAVTAKKR